MAMRSRPRHSEDRRRARKGSAEKTVDAETAGAPLIEKLKGYVDLTAEDAGLLGRLTARRFSFAPGQVLVVQGRSYQTLYALNAGLALRYIELPDGQRQVLNLVVPGDLVGLPACLFTRAIASVHGLTETNLSELKFEELFDLFHQSPRVAAALFWISAREAGIYAERLAAIGRRSAYQRLAHLLLELLTRLHAVGLAEEASFELPLTQEMLGDALGLSLQHVNRMIRMLRNEGLASLDRRAVTIHDKASLARIAGFDDTYLMRQKILGIT